MEIRLTRSVGVIVLFLMVVAMIFSQLGLFSASFVVWIIWAIAALLLMNVHWNS